MNELVLERTIQSLVAFEDVAHCGARLAYRFRIGPESEHTDVTFLELRAMVVKRASWLRERGCRRGQRVALLMPPSDSPRLIATFFGCLYAGFVPSIIAWPTAKMDPDKYRRNVEAILNGLKADWLVTDEQTSAGVGRALGGTAVIDPSTTDGASHASVEPEPLEHGIAFIQFSGGTTGTQKSVPISYEELRRQFVSYMRAVALTDDDRFISWLPLYHDMGLIGCLLLPFVNRLPVTLFAPMEWVRDPHPFLTEIGRDRSTLCWLPNFAYSFLATRFDDKSNLDLSSLRMLTNGSEPVRAESMEAFAARFEPHGFRREALHACYGMAEATMAVATTNALDPPRTLRISNDLFVRGRVEPTDGGTRLLVSCGRPIDGMALKIVDGEGVECGPGVIGEIWLRAEFMMADYLDAAASDRGARWAFSDGWYRTGDLGTVVDGHVYVTGRKKDMLIVAGVNIYPEDVELAVGQLQRVHAGRVVAMGIEDASRGTERFVVVAEVNDEADLASAPEIEADIRQTALAVSTVAPDSVLVVPPRWIIKSTAGKISRPETRAKVLVGEEKAAAELEPTMPVDPHNADSVLRFLIALLTRTLNTTTDLVTPHSRLRSLGVGSLTASWLNARLRRDVGAMISPEAFESDATLAELAARLVIDRDEAAAEARLPSIQPASSREHFPLSYSQARFWGWETRHPGSCDWNLAAACSFEGLHAEALGKAVNELVRRHEILRTTFATIEGRAVQNVRPAAPIEIPVRRLAPGETPEGAVAEMTRRELELPFDLANGPLTRFRLLELGGGRHAFVTIVHHLVVDAAGIDLLFQELFKLYAALSSGKSLQGRPPRIQYADYAVWQRSERTTQALAAEVAFWRSIHPEASPAPRGPHGLKSATDPVPDRAFRAAASFGHFSERLEEFARRARTNVAGVGLAALSLVLREEGFGETMIIGVPVASRGTLVEARTMIGCFVDTVMLRVDTGGNPTAAQLLARIDDALLLARKHGDAPLALVRETEDPMTEAPFSVIYNVLPPESRIAAGGMTYPLRVPTRATGARSFVPHVVFLDRNTGMLCVDTWTSEGTAARWAAAIVSAMKNLVEGVDVGRA